MTTALITTTIHVPEVLRTYRAIAPGLAIYVAGDLKTPHDAAAALCAELGACYLYPDDQEHDWPELSRVTGWNTIDRRNFALLAAVHDGHDVIITIDDDNEPVDGRYLMRMTLPFDDDLYDDPGPAVKTVPGFDAGGCFNVGALATPPYPTRGLPWSSRGDPPPVVGYAARRPTGIVQGLIYGNVDLGAVDRAVSGDGRVSYSELLRDDVWVPPGGYATVNTQNTAFRRELAPAMAVVAGTARYDDIWMGYLAQRVAREHGWGTRFGGGAVYQARHPHNHWRDIADELFGGRLTEAFLTILDATPLTPGASVLQHTDELWTAIAATEGLRGWDWTVSPGAFRAAWIDAITAALDGRTCPED